MEKPLLNQVALVTGGARGIGRAIALRLAKDGAKIAVNDLDEAGAKSVVDEIVQLGGKAVVTLGDVSKRESAQKVANQCLKELGNIHILVNNAGITRDALLLKLTEENWDLVMGVNLKGPFNLGQICAQTMSENKTGRIINISSIARLGNIGQSNYSASKAGIVGLTKTWALELAKYNILVNAIAPGIIDSILTRQIPDQVMEKFKSSVPLRRIGDPEDIANVVSFLSGPQSSYITGQVFPVDGGLSTGF